MTEAEAAKAPEDMNTLLLLPERMCANNFTAVIPKNTV